MDNESARQATGTDNNTGRENNVSSASGAVDGGTKTESSTVHRPGERGVRYSLNTATQDDIAAEMSQTKARYTRSKATRDKYYLKATNGKKSNLTEQQWLMVRTSRFKQWFGEVSGLV